MKVWVDHMVDHFSTYIYQKRGFYHFSRRVPKDVQPLHGKQRIVLALNTRSRAKALKYSQVICQRLDERWLPVRLDAMGLGNALVDVVRQQTAPLRSEAVAHYLQLKGIGKAKTFHQAALRNAFAAIYMPEAESKKRVSIPVETIRQIQQSCVEHDDDMRWLIALISDTGMRLAEAAGLHVDDIKLEKISHTWISSLTHGGH